MTAPSYNTQKRLEMAGNSAYIRRFEYDENITKTTG